MAQLLRGLSRGSESAQDDSAGDREDMDGMACPFDVDDSSNAANVDLISDRKF
jgi:hypothetical protein